MVDYPRSARDADRRSEDRHGAELRVEYRRVNGFIADWTRNISKGGTFIRSEEPLEPGTVFVFSIVAPSLAAPLRLRGRVMWIIPPERATRGAPAGMGVRFEWDDEAERADAEAKVEALVREQLGPRAGAHLLRRR